MNKVMPQTTPPEDDEKPVPPRQDNGPQNAPPQAPQGSAWSPSMLVAVIGLVAIVIIILLMVFNMGNGTSTSPGVSQDANQTPAAGSATPAPNDSTTQPAPAGDNSAPAPANGDGGATPDQGAAPADSGGADLTVNVNPDSGSQ